MHWMEDICQQNSTTLELMDFVPLKLNISRNFGQVANSWKP